MFVGTTQAVPDRRDIAAGATEALEDLLIGDARAWGDVRAGQGHRLGRGRVDAHEGGGEKRESVCSEQESPPFQGCAIGKPPLKKEEHSRPNFSRSFQSKPICPFALRGTSASTTPGAATYASAARDFLGIELNRLGIGITATPWRQPD